MKEKQNLEKKIFNLCTYEFMLLSKRYLLGSSKFNNNVIKFLRLKYIHDFTLYDLLTRCKIRNFILYDGDNEVVSFTITKRIFSRYKIQISKDSFTQEFNNINDLINRIAWYYDFYEMKNKNKVIDIIIDDLDK